ncbi:MAG: hypothetical protein ACO397_07280 [Gammaproteobacteria bacterium]|jgi:hypothetical protein
MDTLKKALGLFLLALLGLIMLIMPASADVKVTITRDLPNERQHIVQQFPDMDGFEMWMQQRLEDSGCDPYVTEMKVDFDYMESKS